MRVRATLDGWAVLEGGLLVVGLVFVGVFGWYQFEERYYQVQYQRDLDQVFAELESTDTLPLPTQPTDQPPPVRPSRLQEPVHKTTARPSRNLFGRLRSERLGIDVAVLDGLDTKTLRRAAGRLPRDGSNQVIAAHRDSYFRPLRQVKPGDHFTLETLDGSKREYIVEWMKVVEPSSADVMADTEGDTLTLITCFPFDHIGAAPRRFVVRAAAE